MERLRDFASSVPDFRRLNKGNVRHKLSDMIILMILARISRHAVRAGIIEFARYNLGKFQKIGMLCNGVPSESTLCRVENGMDDLAMAESLRRFSDTYHTQLAGLMKEREIICIDGKAERGTILENGRNPDIVSAYSYDTGIVLATEACREKSNEIKAVPALLDKIDICGKIVTADAMSMQKDIVDKIRQKGGDFLIELKANQRSLRYGVEDCLMNIPPVHTYTYGPELGHGRIETRTYNIYRGLDAVVDKEKWGGGLTIVEYHSHTIKKLTGEEASEKRLYATSMPVDTPDLGLIIRRHWSIESMHWGVDRNFLQDSIKRKYARAARNLDTIQRLDFSILSIWRGLRKKRVDKEKGNAELMRYLSMSMIRLMRFLGQK